MPLTPPVWGPAIAAAVKSVGVEAGTPIDDAKLIEVWTAVAAAHATHIGLFLQLNSPAGGQPHVPAGPVPIITVPGEFS